MENVLSADTAHFSTPHLVVHDRGAFAAVDQEFADGMDDGGLGGEEFPFQTRQHALAVGPHLSGIDRRVGAVQGFE
jgi:hypothetical protein